MATKTISISPQDLLNLLRKGGWVPSPINNPRERIVTRAGYHADRNEFWVQVESDAVQAYPGEPRLPQETRIQIKSK